MRMLTITAFLGIVILSFYCVHVQTQRSLAVAPMASNINTGMTQSIAIVSAITGSAQACRARGQEWQPIKAGDTFRVGSTITTGTNSQVDLFIGTNGPVLRLTEDTTLLLKEMIYARDYREFVIATQLDLKNGRIIGEVNKLAVASRYEVRIPGGMVLVNGKKYDISTTLIKALDGPIIVNFKGNKGSQYSENLNAGMAFILPATPDGNPSIISQNPITSEMETNMLLIPVPPRR